MYTFLRRIRPTIVVQKSMSLSSLSSPLSENPRKESPVRALAPGAIPDSGDGRPPAGAPGLPSPSVLVAALVAPNALTRGQERHSMTTAEVMVTGVLGLKVGELVQVRSPEE